MAKLQHKNHKAIISAAYKGGKLGKTWKTSTRGAFVIEIKLYMQLPTEQLPEKANNCQF